MYIYTAFNIPTHTVQRSGNDAYQTHTVHILGLRLRPTGLVHVYTK